MEKIEDWMSRIEAMLRTLVERQTVKDWYTTEEFARLTGRGNYTVREWCRLGRVKATKRQSGHGKSKEWVISHEELQRFQKDGLLPFLYRQFNSSAP